MDPLFPNPSDAGPGGADPVDWIIGQRQSAQVNALQGLDQNPDDGARALELGKATGVDPSIVHGDLENFEKQHKAALTSQLLQSNQFLRDYANSQPLAATVSNDDWGQLDEVSRRVTGLFGSGTGGLLSAPADAVEAGVKGFYKSFVGEGKLGQSFIRDEDAQFAQDHPVLYGNLLTTAQAIGTPVEVLNRTIAGIISGGGAAVQSAGRAVGMDEDSVKRLPEDVAAIADAAMMTAVGGPHPVEPVEAGAAKQQLAMEVYRAARPFVENGEKPPVGLHEAIDKVYADQAKQDVKDLTDLQRESEASSTKERAPDLFEDFIKSHGDSTVHIDAEAVAKLYGDKVPTPDDNLLGMVPDIAKQLETAKEFGGRIEVPLSTWLAKVDPEVAKGLKDDISVRRGGMTINETKPPEVVSTDAGPPREKPETIVSAAIRNTDTGEMFTGVTHADAFNAGQDAAEKAGKEWFPNDFAREKGGFVTSTGRYVSREEASEIADRNEQLKFKSDRLYAEDFKEPLKPKPPPIDTLDAIRRPAGLDPMAAPGQMRLARVAPEEGALPNEHTFDIQDAEGKRVGGATIQEGSDGRSLHVSSVVGGTDKGLVGFFGQRQMLGLLRQLQEEFPHAETIGGFRISGAREEAQKPGLMSIPLRPSPSQLTDFMRSGFEPLPIRTSQGDFNLQPKYSTTIGEAIPSEAVARVTDSPVMKAFGERIHELAKDVPIHVIDREDIKKAFGQDAMGFHVLSWDGKSNIFLPDDISTWPPEQLLHIIMHEGEHAVSVGAIVSYPEIRTKIRSLMNEVSGVFNDEERQYHDYAFTNEKEFMAEARSHENFQERLKSVQIPQQLWNDLGKGTAWDALKYFVKEIWERITG